MGRRHVASGAGRAQRLYYNITVAPTYGKLVATTSHDLGNRYYWTHTINAYTCNYTLYVLRFCVCNFINMPVISRSSNL